MNECRAKDPGLCLYHGYPSRINNAVKDNDFASYFEARQETEERDLDRERVNYLEQTQAVPTPMEAYALWATVYESQGNKIAPSRNESNFNSFGYVITPDPEIGAKDFSYKSLAWKRWTPTKGGVQIPAGYGSGSMELFILPDVVNQPMHKALNRRYEVDTRSGWEYGHTRVFILERLEDGSLHASTNQPPRSYADVDSYRKGKTVEQLMAALQKARAGAIQR